MHLLLSLVFFIAHRDTRLEYLEFLKLIARLIAETSEATGIFRVVAFGVLGKVL